MENVKETITQEEIYVKTKAYQDFINKLSQIIEKYGSEVLNEINHIT